MATLDSVKAKIQGLIDKANRTTGNTDTQLSPAVDALIEGYGSGGGGFVDVTELPNISEAEEGVVYRLLQATEASVDILVSVNDGSSVTTMTLAEMFAAEGVSIKFPMYIVPELPEVMKPMDEANLTIPFYIIESTGIAYLSLDGTNAEVATIGEMFDAPDGNGGWVESADSIPTDNLQLGMNFFCVRKEASVEIKGLYLAVDGKWQRFNEIIDVEELPVSGANQHAIYRVGKTLHRGLYLVDASRNIHDFAEYCEENNMQFGTVEFVSTLPDVAESDKTYVLNATGELYTRGSDGRPQNANENGLFVLFFGGSHGWTDPDAINLFKPGIYTCTGEGFNAKEMCRYVDGAWMIYSIENHFADFVSGKLEHITSKELKQVSIITQGAFSDMYAIKSIEIPATMGTIQQMAFKNCYNLETVNFLGDSCSIGRSAFEGCTSLKNINIEDLTGIDTVEYCAFKDCTALESVEIRPSNRYFWEWGNFVFEGCTSLKKVVLDFINSDGDVDPIGTFKNCSSLTEFVLPDEWQYGDLPTEMFRGCKALKDIQLTWGAIGPYAFMESGITNCHFNGTKAQWQQVEKGYWWDRYTPDYVIHCTDGDILKSDPESGSDDRPDEPEGGEKCVNFYDYDGTLLHSYTIAETQALKKLPELPTQPGLVCQGWNYDLETIKEYKGPVDVGATYITDDGKSRLYIKIAAEGRMDVPLYFSQSVANGVTIDWGDGSETQTSGAVGKTNAKHTYASIGEYVITLAVASNCTLKFGDDQYRCVMGSTSNDGLVYCDMLQKVEIGGGVADIGTIAFSMCFSLANITIPYGVTNVGANAFKGCYALTSIVIPNGVKKCGNGAFTSCFSLKSITIPNSVTSISVSAFNGCHSLASIVIPGSVSDLGDSSFSGCVNLANFTIHDGVKSIGSSVFSGCRLLVSITIPNSVTSIGANAFNGCHALTSIIIPDGVTSIGDAVFQNCHNLASITMSDNLKSIGSKAFQYCYALTSITIPSSVTSIGTEVFYNCYSLKSVVLPDIGALSAGIFYGCYILDGITIPNSVTSIGASAFSNCNTLKSITIPSSVTSLSSNSFYQCYNLDSIIIPDGVTSIGSSAFQYCVKLSKVEIPDGVTSIQNNTFQYCYSLTSITIPSSVTSIGTNAFYYCYGVKYFDFTSHTTVPTLSGASAFTGITSDCEIRVPAALYDQWIAATNWSSLASKIVAI